MGSGDNGEPHCRSVDYNHQSDKEMKRLSETETAATAIGGCLSLLLIAATLLAALLLGGCTKRVYVPVESVRTEYKERHTVDTVSLTDSVYVKEWLRGDTVILERERWRTQYRVSIKIDTIARIDSIAVPYPIEVVKEVAKPLRWWQSALMCIGAITAAGGAIAIAQKFRR